MHIHSFSINLKPEPHHTIFRSISDPHFKIEQEMCSMLKKIIAPLFVTTFLFIACSFGGNKTSEQVAGIANPASVYCIDQGGTLELRTDPDGGVYGVCIFSDGSECEEWAYFRNECQPGQSQNTLVPDQPAATEETSIETTVNEIGWLTFTNDSYGYQINYPPDAQVEWSGITGYPTDEMPQGMDPGQYMEQLEQQYGEQLCVTIIYSLGYIHILPDWENSVKYNVCGRTGVGAGEMLDKSEVLTIDGETYTVDGFEWLGGGENLSMHNETMVVILNNGTRIEYGARPVEDASFEDYLLNTRPTLLTMVQSFSSLP